MCLGVPGQIVEVVNQDFQIAQADVSGVRRNVHIGLVSDGPDAVKPGDWVLIHVGFAISRIDEAEARATREFLMSLGDQFEQELDDLRASSFD